MSEHYTDLFSTTVSNGGSGYTGGSGVLHVVSTAGLTASCTLVIETSGLPRSVLALLTVTAVTNSTTLAVTSEGVDTNASDGDVVYAVLSKRALDGIRADMNGAGAYSSLPASGVATGDMYRATDIGVDFRWSGSAWQAVGGPKMTNVADVPPTSANAMDDEFYGTSLDGKWTIRNQQTGQSVTVGSGMVHLVSPSTDQHRIYDIEQSVSGLTSWKFRTKFIGEAATFNYFGYGFFVRRTTGTDKTMMTGFIAHSSYGMWSGTAQFYTGTTFGSDVDLYDIRHQVGYLEMEYDGTNIITRYSTSGTKFTQLYTITASSAIGGAPETIAIGMHSYGDSNANMSMCVSYPWFRRIS